MTSPEPVVRVDSWIWSVRLVKTRSQATAACRGGHVRLNGDRVKPAHAVHVGDEVRIRREGYDRIVVVRQLLSKRTSAEVAAGCYVDLTPPRPVETNAAPVAVRERGAGRPTKRDRRAIQRFRDQ